MNTKPDYDSFQIIETSTSSPLTPMWVSMQIKKKKKKKDDGYKIK